MNYRHAYHAGNFADVFKHCLLLGLVRAMQRKEKGFVFVDTHAGRGRYDLLSAASGDTLPRSPEWPDGIGRIWGRVGLPGRLGEYLGLVADHDRSQGNLGEGPRFYPGSPGLAQLALRPQDRMELWERHPEECAALRDAFGGLPGVAVHEADGYGAARACLPPRERRALVLVDPPFEDQDEWARIRESIGEGVRRFPSGTYAIWHPITQRAQDDHFYNWLKDNTIQALHAELTVDPDGARIRGCGIYVINPPWKFEEEARETAQCLADILYRATGAQGSVRWISPR